jgi:L-malate glycosyltransferase
MQDKQLRIFLISNMYPTKKNPVFGIFVKRVETLLINNHVEINYKAVLNKDINKLSAYLYLYYQICKIYFRKDYDLIYIHYPSHITPILSLLFLFSKRKIISNLHGNDISSNTFLGKVIGKLSMITLLKSDVVIVPSKFFFNLALKKNIKLKDKLYIYPSGGIRYIENYKKTITVIDDISLGFLSRIMEKKGIFVLVRAIVILKEKYLCSNILIHVGGAGEDFNTLKQEIIKNNLEDNFKLYSTIKHSNLEHFFSKIDLFIFPTLFKESLGLVALEAMSFGVPVVGSKIGAIPEYIEDNKNGLLFDANSASDLAMKINQYIQFSDAEKLSLSIEARNTSKLYEENDNTKNLVLEIKRILL